ncbi:Universal stress protein UspA [Planctomycetales bacterium 10988]|nr:Universal stress protein UspA [Planctomycetales bacterium 10988]
MSTEPVQLSFDKNVLEVRLTGKLTKEDYVMFVPAMENLVAEHGKIHLLLILHDFHGWTAGALWEDIKFEMKHSGDIAKLAIVGETKWEKGMAAFCKPFTSASIKYFDHTEVEAARQWVSED